MSDKTVRINVDSQEAQNFQSTMRRNAEQLARDMIRSSRSYSTSAKEVLKDIEEQIRAIEKRNSLDQEFQRTRLESLRGRISDTQFAKTKDQIQREAQEDKLQTKLLREIIETIKSTSKEEIREDRKNVSSRIASSRTVGKLGISGDELASLKETIQQGILGDINVQEVSQNRGFNLRNLTGVGSQLAGGNIGGAMMSGGGSMLGSAFSNPLTAIAAVALLAGGFSFIQNKKIGQQLRDYSITTGTSASALFGGEGVVANERGWSKLGLSPIEVLQMRGQMSRSFGGGMDNFVQDEMIGITRSRNISSDQLNRLLSYGRYGKVGDMNALLSTAALENYLKYTGQSLTRLPEVLDTFTNITSNIIQRTGKVDEGRLLETVSGIGQSYGVSGINLNRYTNAFQGAFSRSQNPQLQALQFRVMSELFPTESLWELQTRMSDPLSQSGYMQAMLRRVKSMYGGGEQGKFTMLEMFKPFGLSENDVNNIWAHDFNSYEFNKDDITTTSASYKGEAGKFVSASEQASQKIINSIETLGARMGSMPEDVKEFFESGGFKNIISGAFAEGIKQAKNSDPNLFN